MFNSEHVHVQCVLCLKRHTGIQSITIDLHVNLNQTVRSIFTVLEQALELPSCFMASFQQCNIRHTNCQVINRIYTLSNIRPLGLEFCRKMFIFSIREGLLNYQCWMKCWHVLQWSIPLNWPLHNSLLYWHYTGNWPVHETSILIWGDNDYIMIVNA